MGLENDLTAALRASSATFLGSGTFGDTWCAVDISGIPGPVAVKVLKPEYFNPRLLARETANLNEFDHDNIVRLFDVRTINLQGVERHVIVCEYIDGGNVEDSLRARGLPSHKQVRKFARGLFGAVAELHSKDKIHRDLKPANIMLRDGKWKQPVLIDFGLVRSLTGDTMTRYPAMVGSLPWMAPEQLQGEKARKACDNWACGVILYQLLTGTHPFFHGVTIGALEAEELVDLVSVPPRSLPANVPADLTELVVRLLTPEPAGARGSAGRALKDLQGAS
ncbi:serine/threonine-protein kinase [Microbacterium sp. Bi128]|uniref:serine/threonine-protein kinase n=1 Tax=Microbacterium sp. Bi128 TaxID=2821115 RepID=UPI001D765776|nr:serine/threonine-protein kinase [Microbacterium sp. Bi128]CAH0172909.1 Serine/threonine-protein kinase PrkC [Microbacterium sp. Bi128]